MARLGVVVDLIAVLREARQERVPDPISVSIIAENAGADGIVCHLREDRRYIKERDLFVLKEVVRSHLNIRMPGTTDMMRLALKVLPDMVTIVPQKVNDDGSTSGLEIAGNEAFLSEIVEQLHANNIIAAFSIEPDLDQVKAAARTGVDYIEFHTSTYAHAPDANEEESAVENLRSMAMAGNKLGLGVSAGHCLTYANVQQVACIEQIEELNIGHAIINRALLVGLPQAIRDMIQLIK